MRKLSGFTLVELVVVIAIIALMAAVTVLNINVGLGEPVLNKEMTRLRTAMQFASEEAILFNRSLGIRFVDNQYTFYQLVESGSVQNLGQTGLTTTPAHSVQPTRRIWQEMTQDPLFMARTLPEDYEFEVLLEGIEIVLDIDTVYTDVGEEEIKPQIFIMSDGEFVPDFEIRIIDIDTEQWRSLTVNEDGALAETASVDDEF